MAWPALVRAAMFTLCRACSSVSTARAAGRGTLLRFINNLALDFYCCLISESPGGTGEHE